MNPLAHIDANTIVELVLFILFLASFVWSMRQNRRMECHMCERTIRLGARPAMDGICAKCRQEIETAGEVSKP